MRHTRRLTAWMAALAGLAAVLAIGCHKPQPLGVTVLQPTPQRRLRPQLTQGFYQPGESGTLTAALVGTGSQGDMPSREILILEMVWRPDPGTTFCDPSGISTKMFYIVDLAGSTLVFEGAGMMRVWENKARTELEGELYSSSLRLRAHPGVAEPSMQIISLTGRFRATRNATQTIEQVLQARQYLHAPSAGSP